MSDPALFAYTITYCLVLASTLLNLKPPDNSVYLKLGKLIRNQDCNSCLTFEGIKKNIKGVIV